MAISYCTFCNNNPVPASRVSPTLFLIHIYEHHVNGYVVRSELAFNPRIIAHTYLLTVVMTLLRRYVKYILWLYSLLWAIITYFHCLRAISSKSQHGVRNPLFRAASSGDVLCWCCVTRSAVPDGTSPSSDPSGTYQLNVFIIGIMQTWVPLYSSHHRSVYR
jgi:hypothetical protein